MPMSFKTGGRTPAGCPDARTPKAQAHRNNTIAHTRRMVRPPPVDLCILGTNIFCLYLLLGAQASLPACFCQSAIAGNPAGKDACAPRGFSSVINAPQRC